MVLKPFLASLEVNLPEKPLEPGFFEYRPAKTQSEKVKAKVAEPDTCKAAPCRLGERYHAVYDQERRPENGHILQYECQPEDKNCVCNVGVEQTGASCDLRSGHCPRLFLKSQWR